MSSDAIQFGKVPSAVIAAGELAPLGRRELAVYLVICAALDGRTWSTRLSAETIARRAGMSPRTVFRTLGVLTARNLIEIVEGGGRHRTNQYYVRSEIPCHEVVAVSDAKPCQAEGKTVPSQTRKHDTAIRKPRHSCVAPSEATEETAITERPATAAAEIKQALSQAGIGEPKRTALANMPRITPQVVQRLALDAARQGKGTGALILMLEAESRRTQLNPVGPAGATARLRPNGNKYASFKDFGGNEDDSN